MKGYLLDTGVALFALTTPEVLSRGIRRAIEQGPAYLSVIAYWEATIKSMKGTLDVGGSRQWFGHALEALGLQALLLRPEHIAAIPALAPIHQDPFDRALIAQATVEDLTLLTTDTTITKYVSGNFRTVR